MSFEHEAFVDDSRAEWLPESAALRHGDAGPNRRGIGSITFTCGQFQIENRITLVAYE
jgi:hypothetical protein